MPQGGESWIAAPASRGAGTPERLLDSGFGVRGAREDEEEVRKPVEVDRRERVRVRHCKDRALGPATDRTREEETRRPLAPAGQDEALQLGERRVRLVDFLLEPVDRLICDAQPFVVLGPWD